MSFANRLRGFPGFLHNSFTATIRLGRANEVAKAVALWEISMKLANCRSLVANTLIGAVSSTALL
jgi:hypothetical protein